MSDDVSRWVFQLHDPVMDRQLDEEIRETGRDPNQVLCAIVRRWLVDRALARLPEAARTLAATANEVDLRLAADWLRRASDLRDEFDPDFWGQPKA